jgi:hypothetical protein
MGNSDVGYWGEITLPVGRVAEWQAARLGRHTVEKIIDGASRRSGSKMYFVDVRVDRGQLTVRAVLSAGQDSDDCDALEAVLVELAAHGGEGEVYVMPLDVGSGRRLVVTDGDAIWTRVKRTGGNVGAKLDELMEEMQRREPRLAASAMRQRAQANALVHAMAGDSATALRTRTLAALESHPLKSIVAAAKISNGSIHVGNKWINLAELRDATQILDLLRAPLPPGAALPAMWFSAPLTLLATLDYSSAEKLAIETLSVERPPQVLTGACRVLGRATSVEAIVALVTTLSRMSALDDAFAQGCADACAEALASIRSSEVVPRVLPLVSKPLWKEHALHDRRTLQIGRLCGILGAHDAPAAFELLVTLFETHPYEPVRIKAGQALLLGGRPSKGAAPPTWTETMKRATALVAKRRR